MSQPEPPHLRVGHAERDEAVAELGEHLEQGRIDVTEYAERTAAAYAARTRDELDVLFVDLPRPTTTPFPEIRTPYTAVAVPYPARPPDAPYGADPVTGEPYSDRSRIAAGVLQMVLPFGVGRLYSGHYGIAIAQFLLSFVAIGALWSFVDGILMLLGRVRDPYGRPLRP